MQVWHPEAQPDIPSGPLPQHLAHRVLNGNRSLSCARGATYCPCQPCCCSPYGVGTLFPEKNSSAIHDNLTLALGHRIQPLAAALVRLTDDIFANLGPAEPEYLLLWGEFGEGTL